MVMKTTAYICKNLWLAVIDSGIVMLVDMLVGPCVTLRLVNVRSEKAPWPRTLSRISIVFCLFIVSETTLERPVVPSDAMFI